MVVRVCGVRPVPTAERAITVDPHDEEVLSRPGTVARVGAAIGPAAVEGRSGWVLVSR